MRNLLSQSLRLLQPFLKSLNAIIFADTTIQNMSDLPSPWALEVSSGIQSGLNMAEKTNGGDVNSFALAAIASAIASPSALFDEPKLKGTLGLPPPPPVSQLTAQSTITSFGQALDLGTSAYTLEHDRALLEPIFRKIYEKGEVNPKYQKMIAGVFQELENEKRNAQVAKNNTEKMTRALNEEEEKELKEVNESNKQVRAGEVSATNIGVGPNAANTTPHPSILVRNSSQLVRESTPSGWVASGKATGTQASYLQSTQTAQ